MALDLKAKAEMRLLKWGYWSKWPLVENISQFCIERIEDDTALHVALEFHENWPPGSEWNDALIWWQKVCKMGFSRRHFAPIWHRAPTFCKGACNLSRRLCVKFRPNRCLFAGVISKKWFRTTAIIMPSTCNKKLIRGRETRKWHRCILLPLLRLTPPADGFPWDDLRKILHRCQRMARVQNGKEILPKVSTPWVGRTNVADDRPTTDGFANVTFG